MAGAALLMLWGCKDNNLGPQWPDEDFFGPYNIITLGNEADGLEASKFVLTLKSEDGMLIEREVSHSRTAGISRMELDRGMSEGTYRLLYARFKDGNDEDYEEFGFGSRIKISAEGVEVIDVFNPTFKCAGRGTAEDPFIVSSSSHLFNLMMEVNDYDSNKSITSATRFEQVCDIDMKSMSRSCDSHYGWMPIGADTNTPFRGTYSGGGYTIKNLIINRPNSAGVGLFGFVCEGSVDDLNMADCTVTGQFAVGVLAGGVITSGNGIRGTGTFTNCRVSNSTLDCPSTSASVGGILGGVDMHARALIAGCEVDGGSVSGGMNVGGLSGGAGIYSSIMFSDCKNSASVKSMLSGAGGMIGTADTLQIAGCYNYGLIKGSTEANSDNPGLGTGGLAGGGGMSWISGSVNYGAVNGLDGVGGIIGSTRVTGSGTSALYYNQAFLRYCGNEGDVTGITCVGGAIGDAQAGTYAVYNKGAVRGEEYVGGICGASSIAVVHNTYNSGDVTGSGYVAGILGKCTWGSLAINQNSGKVNATSGHTAGIVGLAGNNTVLNYCSNFGEITGTSSAPVAGIVAEVGDPREWTAMNIAECVIGSMEIVMAFVGPVIAITEVATELAHAAEVVLKVIEIVPDVLLQVTDYSLLGYGIYEMVSPEVEEALKASIDARIEETSNSVMNTMTALRREGAGNVMNFSNVSLATSYTDNVEQLVAYYQTEGNDEIYNEGMNEAREERGEALEKVQKTKEIIHSVIGGVAVVCSTAALIAGTIASGGAATAIMVAGSAAAIIGGANAIIKSCTEFESNAVVISQCVNAGAINASGNGKASSIVGKLYDGCLVENCLNTAPLNVKDDKGFVGESGSHSEISHCVSLIDNPEYATDKHVKRSIYHASWLADGTKVWADDYVCMVAPDLFANKNTYTECGINLGKHWIIPEGSPFAIPYKSQMQK